MSRQQRGHADLFLTSRGMGDHTEAYLHDPSLVVRNFSESISQHLRVLETKRCDARAERRGNDIGRVVAAP